MNWLIPVNDWLTVGSAISLFVLLSQVPAAAILLSRLLKGPSRQPPIAPGLATPELLGTVSVIVPTLNEAERIGPCLSGLSRQGYEVREVIVVDSNSQDGTPELVEASQRKDPRFRLITDDPLPDGWVGRPWALHNGFLQVERDSSCMSPVQWILGIDADTQPQPGLVAGLVRVAQAEGYDMVSLSPRFILKYPGECWLQPALLMTLLYRFNPVGTDSQADRVMANGQCFLSRRTVLAQISGYTGARSSFCDDVTLARNAAACGFKVGFLDGAKVLKVRMYEGAFQTWKEWGRSLDLKDACSTAQLWSDLWLLLAVQGLPLPIVLSYLIFSPHLPAISREALKFPLLLLGLNLFLLTIRFALLLAIAPAYDRSKAFAGWLFWFSPLADPLAVLRIFLSALRTPTQWRGREY